MFTKFFIYMMNRALGMLVADAEQEAQVQTAMNTANRKASLAKEANRLREGGYEDQAVELEELATEMTVESGDVSLEYRETAPLAIEDQSAGKKRKRR